MNGVNGVATVEKKWGMSVKVGVARRRGREERADPEGLKRGCSYSFIDFIFT